MYVILVNDDNTLITTNKERIMQRSKLVDTLMFLVPQYYNEHNMSDFTVSLEYVLPISREYKNEILVVSDEKYNNHLIYKLPFDTCLTAEHGDIELNLSFLYINFDADGNVIQRVRKTSSTKIVVIPTTSWSNIIPDSALSALDQRIIKTDAQIKALAQLEDYIANSKADNLKYYEDENALQLTSNGNEIGSKVILKCNSMDKDGIPAVDFGNISDDEDVDNPGMDDNVVEF